MGQANAYFQFVIKEHATYIKLFPAALEGNVIEIGELTEYRTGMAARIII